MGNGKSTSSTVRRNVKYVKSTSDLSTSATVNRRLNMQRMQNVILIWLDSNINDNNAHCRNTIQQLKCLVNNVNTFTDGEQCVKYIQTIVNNKVYMIVSGSLGQHIVPHVHDMCQVDTIFIFCNNQEWHKQWAKEWSKIKGVFTDIIPICEALKQAAHRCEQKSISISFVASNKKFDQLDPSFMYTQILKEILLQINFEDKHIKEFITYSREVFDENELKNVNQLQTAYKNNVPIWWYTSDAFLYRTLNWSLRLMDVDMIVRMGFFINDLHRDIQRLHSEQSDRRRSRKTFIVYRGQGLSKQDFTEMTKTNGGLLSFNNFLSTSKKHNVSLKFAQEAATNPDLVGILFVMSIDPTNSTIPFASVTDVSYFHTEHEILFSMHTIFRIEGIKPMKENIHLYKVKLTLANDNDQNLRTLTDCIRQETFPDSEGWDRLGLLLIKMGQYSKAQEVYEVLLHQITHESDKAHIYHQIGSIKYNQGKYQEALTYYEKAFPSNHLSWAMSYNNIGLVFYEMGDYPKALTSHEKALAVKQQLLPSDHPDLTMSYNNIGLVYYKMGDYPKALSYYEKALAIQQQTLPSNHSDLGVSYNNIGSAYSDMGDYSKALSSHEKALAIKLQSLSSDHSDLAVSYNNIGLDYYNMHDYPKALSHFEKALAIKQQSLPSNHPSLSSTYNNVGLVYENMNNYAEAHSFYEQAVQIGQQSLSTNHPDLKMYRKNLEIIQKKL
ncbi:unnamed protein product [Adineta steineri]|uniref:UDP-N-acetylglucosamine--peptide N-acetylglucosaminyltransferase SPINDLY n=1 Tax=Adineta steineri TaxID=433720 RepID=A0A818HSS6_9BILA|nr:unnamed protein product [Adineta steineri]CAF3513715.1 unnamed protein product [Adineta steineri]